MAKLLIDKLENLNLSKSISILDAGAGTGIFSHIAVEKGYKNVTLLDINESMLNEAILKPNLTNKKFIQGDATSIKLNEKYDAIVSIMMFDKLSEIKLNLALKNLCKSLSYEGYIFLMEDNKRDIYLNYFHLIEDGFYTNPKVKNLTKYYFIGKMK